ncbi:hypothetical protein E2C01_088095 [Portunus trituberculatus]|uniref:Uncharacterized protein n=1 Tax=Portunus trituberculatus TaxID=210409 RepID=A0A5B7JDK2_PORTR|nr:hypothetical protein [Portunus trituberculatus]
MLPTFSQVEKGILRRSPIFSPLLFDEAKLQEAIQSSKSNAAMTLHETALRALARPHPATGGGARFSSSCPLSLEVSSCSSPANTSSPSSWESSGWIFWTALCPS